MSSCIVLKNRTKYSVQDFEIKVALENTTSKNQNLEDVFLTDGNPKNSLVLLKNIYSLEQGSYTKSYSTTKL